MTQSILIVEDDLTFATMLKTWLGKKGYEVETASTNARARKLLTTRDFSLILSDLRLPDQDGIHLLSWLRDLQKATPVIIMTSYAEIQGAVLAMKEGAADYVSKPVQPDELLKKSRKQSHRRARLLLHPRKARKTLPHRIFWKEKAKQPASFTITSTWLLQPRCLS